MDFESSLQTDGITESVTTRWWVAPVANRDAYALYVVRYTIAQPGGEFLRAEHLTGYGWLAHDLGVDIDPAAVIYGMDIEGLAYAKDPAHRQGVADRVTTLVKDAVTAALRPTAVVL